MCAKSSTGRTQPRRREISTTSSIEPSSRTRPITSIAERHGAVLLLEPLAQLAELLDDRVDRLLARPAEQEAGVEDDDLGAGRLRDAGRVVEHPDRHVQLLAALGVAHEAGDRRVHRERDVALARELAERARRSRSPSRSGPRSRSRRPSSPRSSSASTAASGRLPRRDARGAVMQLSSHATREPTASVRPTALPTLIPMAEQPIRIDLLELDIDLRLADLWREAAGISEWSLDVVAAFMRAAYGKGYCDALTEDSPGSLCADHGYRVPGAQAASRRLRLTPGSGYDSDRACP